MGNKKIILKTKNVKKHFGGVKAVDGVDIELYEGETLGIIGPNGAGKTTFFNTICGVYEPTDGIILFKNKEIQGLKPHIIARLGIGRTFQIAHPFKDLTLIENIVMALGKENYEGIFRCFRKSLKKDNIKKARELLKLVGLLEYQNDKAENLSLGHMRRLGIARALALEPKILMLDEPCAGLSFDATKEFVELIHRLKSQGTTIVVIEHNMAVTMEISDRIVVLSYGEKIAEGLPEEIQKNEEVIEAYLGKDDEIA